MREAAVASPVLDLPATSESVRAARRYVADRLTGWGMDTLVDTATLLVSEVVTNSVLHARTDVHLAMTRSGADSVTISVADRSQRLPHCRHYARDATTGRGLTLLNQLASEWQVTPTPRGKTVSFTMILGADPWRAFEMSDWESVEG